MRESEMLLMAPVEAKRGTVVTDMESGRSRSPGLTRVTEKERRNGIMPCPCLRCVLVNVNQLSLLGSFRPFGELKINSHGQFPRCRENDLPRVGDHVHISR